MNRIINIDGEDYRVLAVGAEVDGEVCLHLASTTRGRQQANGWVPSQINHWVAASDLHEEGSS